MAREYRLKTFKSGNSVAMRLPKSLGMIDGDEVSVVAHRDGSFSLWKVDAAKAVFMALCGSLSAGFMRDGRAQGMPEERDWSHSAGSAEAA